MVRIKCVITNLMSREMLFKFIIEICYIVVKGVPLSNTVKYNTYCTKHHINKREIKHYYPQGNFRCKYHSAL